jgi:TIR domain
LSLPLAVHAIALSKPNGHKRVLSFAKEYLESHQNWRGHWDDKDACDITYLTVLVLDALQLAVSSDVLTFSRPSSIMISPPTLPEGKRPLTGNRRFSVALSFPGEKRYFVKEVADHLGRKLGRERVFYDAYYEAELAKTDLDTILQSVYHDECDLVIVFSCADYEKQEWCGLEWRGIRDIIKQRRGTRCNDRSDGQHYAKGTLFDRWIYRRWKANSPRDC